MIQINYEDDKANMEYYRKSVHKLSKENHELRAEHDTYKAKLETFKTKPINIIFDGPPGKESGRFIEIETDAGASVKIGEWIKRDDGYFALRIISLPRDEKEILISTDKGKDSNCRVCCKKTSELRVGLCWDCIERAQGTQ